MPRGNRIILPGVPHHITQRGNQKQKVFYDSEDYYLYLQLLRVYSIKLELPVLAYCLMPNHVHIIAIPQHEDHLRAVLAPVHTLQAQSFNRKHGSSGHLWQGRYSSIALDDEHCVAALRYIELNPVRAGFVNDPYHWHFSSARIHASLESNSILTNTRIIREIGDWTPFLQSGLDLEFDAEFQRHEKNGYPLAGESFLSEWEQKTGQSLKPSKRGRPAGWRKPEQA